MNKTMLIDAGHPEEVRVAVVEDGRVEEFDFESASKRQLRGNIYLAKVTRVEPSLQAAFVEYGGNRHGFLAFSEIHPDYYHLPHEDKEALLEEEAAASSDDDADADGEDDDETPRPRNITRRYKIQEVIRRRQVLLVQVVKEERGNKGAALTTYLSLAGRYGVLMPNTPRGGGISRKITNASDRKRLKTIVSSFEVPKGMGLIVRTAGAKRTKTEIKRDFDYLTKLWDKIKEQTFSSIAPSLIHQEGDLVQRAMRDMYDKDVEAVLVDGEKAYREAKDLAKMLMPSHAKKVQVNKETIPLFSKFKIEDQLNTIFDPVVQLKSGGYLVIHQTEALVAIDVNSGKATRERNIENTALKTNLEAAAEACRQMRLRDLAGLIVIDFIDMEENKNNRAVERRMKDCLKLDRARVQNGKISMFGLMEISRQRRRAGVLDSSSQPCEACDGTGRIRSVDSAALQLLRAIEARAMDDGVSTVAAMAPTDVVLYLLNEKRIALNAIEASGTTSVRLTADAELRFGDFSIEVERDGETETVSSEDISKSAAENTRPDDNSSDDSEGRSGRGRRRRRRGRNNDTDQDKSEETTVETASDDSGETGTSDRNEPSADDDEQPKKRRRRGRRGGRRRRNENQDGNDEASVPIVAIESSAPEDGGAHLDGLTLVTGEAIDSDMAETAETVETANQTPADDTSDAEAVDPTPTPDAAISAEAEVVSSETVDVGQSVTVAIESIEVTPEPTAEEVETVSDDATEPAAETVEEPPKQGVTLIKTEVTPDDQSVEVIDTDSQPKKRRGWWQRNQAS